MGSARWWLSCLLKVVVLKIVMLFTASDAGRPVSAETKKKRARVRDGL
jgi:hypothetical protein